MDAALDVQLIRRADVMARSIGDGAVLVDMRSGACFELNRTGVQVWELLAHGTTIRSMCEVLAERYDVSRETLLGDVSALVDDLARQKLVARTQQGRR